MANRFGGIEGIKEAIKKYGGSGVQFFSLKDDDDSAVVRFLYEGAESLDVDIVHEIEVDGRKKKIQCQQEGCLFCEAYGKPAVKIFLFLFNLKTGEVEIWERGSTMATELMGLIEKYGNLNNRNYEIVRHGKKGDNKTRYQLFPEDKGPLIIKKKVDGKMVETEEPLPEKPDLYKVMVHIWTPEQMADYVADNAAVKKDTSKKGGF